MPKFTVFCRQRNNEGTTYVTCVEAPDRFEAASDAISDCSADWGDGYGPEDIAVMCVIEGDAKILNFADAPEWE